MTLAEQIAEKERIGNDLLAEDLGLHTMTFIIENIEPETLEAYAEETHRSPEPSNNRLRLFISTQNHKISVLLYSLPVKISKTVSYERI